MKRAYKASLAVGTAVLIVSTFSCNAGLVLIDFDSVNSGATVDEFYNGGTDSLGGSGLNYGVSFGPSNDWRAATGFGQTSQPFLAYSISGAGSVDVIAGFSGVLSFTYGAFSPASVSIFSGLAGTGTLLTSVALPASNPYAFIPVNIPFAGTAQSIVISGSAAGFGWDDLSLVTVPEPTTWSLLAGLGLLSFAASRRLRH